MQGKKVRYASKVTKALGNCPAKAAENFLDADWAREKAIVKDASNNYFTVSTTGILPRRFELLGIFNCNMPYRDLVRELAA